MKYTVESDIGLRRAVNEDRAAFFQRPDHYCLAIIADGMGGHNAGDVASDMAVTTMGQLFAEQHAEQFSTAQTRQHWLKQSIEKLNEDIYQYSLSHENCKGMGTTFVAMLIDNIDCTIAHVGDSRVYHFFQGGVQQITRDHSYVNILVDKGEISEQEALTHPKKNYILKALGTEPTIEPDYYHIQMLEQDYLLLCSDGLSNKMTVREMASILTLDMSLQRKGEKLVRLANDSGGEDNISLVLISTHDQEV